MYIGCGGHIFATLPLSMRRCGLMVALLALFFCSVGPMLMFLRDRHKHTHRKHSLRVWTIVFC